MKSIVWSIFLCAREAQVGKSNSGRTREEREKCRCEGRKGVQHTPALLEWHFHCGRVEIRFPNLTFSRLQNYGGPEKIIIAAAAEFNSQMPNDLILHPLRPFAIFN
jgi:hypothetical protein